MKKIWTSILTFFLLSPVLSLAQVDSLSVSGELKPKSGEEIERVTLSFTDHSGKSYSYSAVPKSGTFEIRVPKQELVVYATLRTVDPDPMNGVMLRPLNLFIHKEDITVKGQSDELDLAVVSGGQENNDYNTLRQSNAPVVRKASELYAPLLKKEIVGDSEEAETIFKQMSVLHRQENDAQKQFIQTHPHSYVSLFLLYRMKNHYTSDAYAQAFNALDTKHRETRMGKGIQGTIEKESVTAKGATALAFERTTVEGNTFKLGDLKGRVFLLDFWGSWCGPCRASMPHLKELHSRYKEKGFEIVGIAQERGKTIEDSKASWEKAINELGIHWINVLNNENKEQFDIVTAYRVSGFPTKILVDEQGQIILRLTASATDDIDVALKKIYGF